MPATKKPAAPRKATAVKKAVAARNEANGVRPTITWRGLEFQGPVKLPGTMVFDLAQAQADESIGGLFAILRDLLGAEGMGRVRERIVELDLDLDATSQVLFVELPTAIAAPYGAELGESNASDGS